MRISDWSSDVCSSDLHLNRNLRHSNLKTRLPPQAPSATIDGNGIRGYRSASRRPLFGQRYSSLDLSKLLSKQSPDGSTFTQIQNDFRAPIALEEQCTKTIKERCRLSFQ